MIDSKSNAISIIRAAHHVLGAVRRCCTDHAEDEVTHNPNAAYAATVASAELRLRAALIRA